MLGAVAVVQQLAERMWQQVQQRAQQDVQVAERAVAGALDTASKALASSYTPVDGKQVLPGYAMPQVVWEVRLEGAEVLHGVYVCNSSKEWHAT